MSNEGKIKDAFYFTKNRKTGSVYAFRYYESPDAPVESCLTIPYAGPVAEVQLLEMDTVLPFEKTTDGIKVQVSFFEKAPFSLTFKITA